jgi:hypothetical protein
VARVRRLTPIFVLLATLLPAGVAQADPFTVINTHDSGDGSLRAAIEGTNNLFGPDTITISATGTIALETPLEPIAEDVEIAGPGAGSLTVERDPDAGAEFRIFEFGSGVDASLSGLTVTNGVASEGAGIYNDNGHLSVSGLSVENNESSETGAVAQARGGGIFSVGPLTVRETVVRDNRVSAEGAGASASAFATGGGVYVTGVLTMESSTISGNVVSSSVEDDGWATAEAGGMRIFTGETLIERSTISGNSAIADGGSTPIAKGGGIKGSLLSVLSSTIVRNAVVSPQTADGANLESGGMMGLVNSIVAEPLGGAESCSGIQASGGFNLDEDGSCEFEVEGDFAGVAAGLDPVLRMNGGPTPTHALLPGSAAIDRGKSFGATVDQRGLPRPSDFAAISNSEGGDGSDIGAFELQAPPVPGAEPARVTEVPADTAPPNTHILRGPARLGFKRLAKFRFASTEPQSHFQCKLDKKKWKACGNPFRRSVKPGKHLFKVRAIDRFGNVDPVPARFGWRVKPLS